MLPLKDFFVKHENRIILFFGVILLSFISYGLGRLSAPQPKEPIKIEASSKNILKEIKLPEEAADNSTPAVDNKKDDNIPQAKRGKYVASKNGTKYHLPGCSGAKRIKEENKIWFDSKAEAEQAGYEPAKNCEGI